MSQILTPITYEVETQPSGYAMTFGLPGETVSIETVGFHSFDEGIIFYTLLESLTSYAHRAGIPPSMVDRMLVILEPNRTTVYINQMFETRISVRCRRRIKAGQPVSARDIAGVERVQLCNVSVPENAGFVLLLSHGWRKAFFYDLRPISLENPVPIDYDVELVGGQLLSHLIFTEYFLLSEDEWDKTISAGWFPFMHLIDNHWETLLGSIKADGNLEFVEALIYNSFSESIDEKLEDWIKKDFLVDEEPFLSRAVEAFKRKDWVTLISLLSPRIEGIIRRSIGSYGKHDHMVNDLEKEITESMPHERSLLFPKHLSRYFRETFLQFVDFSQPNVVVNRHTVAHGAVLGNLMDQSHGLRIMLLLDHLYYCLPSGSIHPEKPDLTK